MFLPKDFVIVNSDKTERADFFVLKGECDFLEAFAEKLLHSAKRSAALFSPEGNKMLFENDAAVRSGLFRGVTLALLPETGGTVRAALESDGYADTVLYAAGAEGVHLSLIACEEGILAVAGDPWEAPVLAGHCAPAADITADAVRNSVHTIYYDAQRLAADGHSHILSEIRRETYSLLRLQENRLIVSHGYAGRLERGDRSCCIGGLVQALCQAAALLCPQGPAIHVAVEGDTMARCNRVLIETAFLNLLVNALIYTRDGNEINVSAVGKNGSVVLTVADRGMGIQQELLARVREPYFSCDPYADGAPRPGVGLGLTVADMAARVHGGRLLIDSRYGEGTTVTMQIAAGEPAADGVLEQYQPGRYVADTFSRTRVQMAPVKTAMV